MVLFEGREGSFFFRTCELATRKSLQSRLKARFAALDRTGEQSRPHVGRSESGSDVASSAMYVKMVLKRRED